MRTRGAEPSIDHEIARISERIRAWREHAGYTLQELARRSGLATSTVQKVETGQMVPSVAVLLKVAHGLGRRPTELIHAGDGEQVVSHQSAGERDRAGSDETLHIERLSGDIVDPALEMWRVTLWPGASSGKAPIRYEGEELVLCEKGRVSFRVGESAYELAAGDTLHFKARVPHSWRNESRGVARFTVVGTLPAKLRALLRHRVGEAREG